MLLLRYLTMLLTATLLLATPISAETAKPRVLVMGDSLMASHRLEGAAVANDLGKLLGVAVKDHSVIAARYFHILPISGSLGMRIDAQLHGGPWDYVVMNGGGNDLLFGCGCMACKKMMERLISANGKSGAIPKLVANIRATGAKVIYTGYMRTPGLTSPIEGCTAVGNELERRLAKMASLDDGVDYIPLADLVKVAGDTSYHGIDLVHPSRKGSAAIAALIATHIPH